MKKFVAVLSAAAMMTSLAACGFTADTANTAASSAETTASAAESTADTAAADSYKVAIVQQLDHASLDEIRVAIEKELDAKAAEKGITIEYKDFNGQNDATTLNQIGTQVVADGYDAIIPIATLAAQCMTTAAVAGHPFLGLPLAMLAGAAAGFITAFLQTKLAVPSILAGIITNTGLYTVNLAVMGFSSNVPMLKTKTVFTAAQGVFGESAPYKLIVAALVTVVVCALLIAFLGTRLGLSIRATGDNPDMVRASSINTAFTITVGLCIANAMTALSGAVLAQYQRSADINLGTGMVVIGLASLIIGETLFGRGGMWVKAVAAVAGSVIYRFIIALALRANVPSECLKLISAVIVALAIAAPALKAKADFRRRRANAQKGGARHA